MNDPEHNPWEDNYYDHYHRGARWADNSHHADPAQDVDPHVQADPPQGVAPSVHADPPQGVAPSVHADPHVHADPSVHADSVHGGTSMSERWINGTVSCVEWLDGANQKKAEEVVERDDVEEEDERDDAEDEKKEEEEEGDVITAAWFYSDEPDWDGLQQLRFSRLWIAFSAKIMIKAAHEPRTAVTYWDAPRLMHFWEFLLQQTDPADLQKEEEADLQKEEEAALQKADLQKEEDAAAEVMDPADLQKEEEAAHAAVMDPADLQKEEEITWLAEAAAEVMDPAHQKKEEEEEELDDAPQKKEEEEERDDATEKSHLLWIEFTFKILLTADGEPRGAAPHWDDQLQGIVHKADMLMQIWQLSLQQEPDETDQADLPILVVNAEADDAEVDSEVENTEEAHDDNVLGDLDSLD